MNIFKRHGTELTFLAGPGSMEVERIRSNVLENPLANQHDSYYKNLAMFTKEVSHININLIKQITWSDHEGKREIHQIQQSRNYQRNLLIGRNHESTQ